MKSRYEVKLSEDEQEILTAIVKRGKGPVYRIKHAHILLHADATNTPETGWSKRSPSHYNRMQSTAGRICRLDP